ncbi:unnamed protein product [Coffea canephora]|uniref:Protein DETOXIFICATION n=1 Tax=Coffea canephora TaxID=49390 RepID=A0A068UBE7_COFCA|nr:unnamed protein product [Coffea canephora]
MTLFHISGNYKILKGRQQHKYLRRTMRVRQDIGPFISYHLLNQCHLLAPGVARGSGWQHLGAYVNLGAYYLVGIPVALILGFALHVGGMGLWSGLVAGATVQSLLLSIITGLTSWENQVIEARRRIYEGEEEKATPV